MLPVNRRISPERARTATPMRSASGSVAMRHSAPVSRIFCMPMERVSAYSGFGCLTVGKRESAFIWGSTKCGSRPKWRMTLGHMAAPVPWTDV